MSLMDTILQRRSVREFAETEIPDEKLRTILLAGLLAPTSMNRKPCEFYVVRDRNTLRELSEAKKSGSAFLAGAACAIAVFADSEKADTWVEDCSITLCYMNLMAAEQGVGSCWCQMHLRSDASGTDAEDRVRTILDVAEKYRIVGILGLGIPSKNATPHKLDDADWSKVHS